MPAHSPIDDRLDFAIINDDVKRTLVEIRPLMIKHLPAVMNRFYDHLKKYPEMVAMFRSEERMDYAKEKQTNHWAEILNGDFGNQYVKSVHKIGRVHNRIGLEPKWYIGGYSFIATGLIQAVLADKMTGLFCGAKRAEVSRSITAFVQAMLLDMDLAISTYLEAAHKDRQDLMHGLSSSFEGDVGAIVTGLHESSESASTNVETVAAATEELAASIKEISMQVTHMASGAQDTADLVIKVSEQVARLDEAAGKIGQIVDMIRSIAEQTNLLALNATIEAARAGEAGKGFAVVASEVKNLAGKTAEATTEIVEQVETIQEETRLTVGGIETIVDRIQGVQERSASVAAAVEEQQAATAEISRSVHQASGGAQETTRQTRLLRTRVDAFLQQLDVGANETGGEAVPDAAPDSAA